MDHFEYSAVFVEHGLHFYCTSSSTIAWFLQELKKHVPDYRSQLLTDVSGARHGVLVDRLSNKDASVKWWLLRELMAQGWEPFYVYGNLQASALIPEFHLKRKLNGTAETTP